MTPAVIETEPNAKATTIPSAVSVRGLTVTFRGCGRILCGLDLDVHPGEHLIVLGPSGCGKTTLLGCIAGRRAPCEGRVERRGTIASIHQDFRLVTQRSARSNVLHGALGRLGPFGGLMRYPIEEHRRADEIMARVGIGHLHGKRVSQLSGGEQQRVAIARALMQDPAVLLADEPVASLDCDNAVRIMALLSDLCHERQIAVVSVVHDAELARRFADRILVVADGRLRTWTPPAPVGPGSAGSAVPAAMPVSLLGVPVPAMNGATRDASGRLVDADAPPTCGAVACIEAGRCAEQAIERARSGEVDLRVRGRVQDGPASLTDASEDGRPWLSNVWAFAFVAIVALVVYGWSIAGLGISSRQIEGAVPGFLGFLKGLWPTSWSQVSELPWATLWGSLIETIQMSIVGTTIGLVISLPLSALAARNLMPRPMVVAMRGILNAIRVVPSLIWALIFVAAVGFGPFAGVLALAAYSVGYLTKFFYESFESADTKPQGALGEIGAGGIQRFVHAVLPAALPMCASSTVFMLEYNVRSASILGIVDAGGIGWHIKHYLDYRNFPAAVVCLLMVLVIVIVLDAISGRIRAWAVRR